MDEPDTTSSTLNPLGQPIGPKIADWRPPPRPPRRPIAGRWCRLEPLDPASHARELYDAYGLDGDERRWTYLPYGPFSSFAAYRAWLERACVADDPLFFAIRDLESERWAGVASYLRIDPPMGSVEVGHICYSTLLQRKRAGTEAMYLMMRQAFELGFRRYEWKCDALNASSRRAALRYGFQFEGVFRQASMYKGRNRDTAWFSVLDREWPDVRSRLEGWLAPENFTPEGMQKSSLRAEPGEGAAPTAR